MTMIMTWLLLKCYHEVDTTTASQIKNQNIGDPVTFNLRKSSGQILYLSYILVFVVTATQKTFSSTADNS